MKWFIHKIVLGLFAVGTISTGPHHGELPNTMQAVFEPAFNRNSDPTEFARN